MAEPGRQNRIHLARQLMVVYDGASVRAGIGADPLDGGLAVTMATALLDAAGVTA